MRSILIGFFALSILQMPAHAQEPVLDDELVSKAKKAVDRGLRFLRGLQTESGSYESTLA